MKNLVILATLFLFPWSIAYGQSNFVITSNSAGGVRLGMTVSQARKSLKGCKFERSSDGEGVALIMITCSGKRIISVFAGEEDIDAVIDARAKIVFIEVWDKTLQDGRRSAFRYVSSRCGKNSRKDPQDINNADRVSRIRDFSKKPRRNRIPDLWWDLHTT